VPLVPLTDLLDEGLKKRRTAYRSGRSELTGFDNIRKLVRHKHRVKTGLKSRDRRGRLIARTPYASKTRWRKW
jgi:hypothetical protein